ncbi:MAG: undecaprenyl diphosphate synthase family protein [Ramlibacter sp.]|nr:undecaprenyl diphosphate synthase family protein [Ramlibacter sp.]
MTAKLPQHIAVIMNGNRRWARQRGLPKAVGHASGAKRMRSLVEACSARGVRWLPLFASSTENWQRPADEVSGLIGLFLLNVGSGKETSPSKSSPSATALQSCQWLPMY